MIPDWNNLDDRVRAAKYLARQIQDPRFLPETEAAVYAFRKVYDVPVDRTAEELDVSVQRVYNATTDVTQRIEDMRETLEKIDTDDGV